MASRASARISKALDAQTLEGIRRSPRLEGSAAQHGAPAALTSAAASSNCSLLSTEQGPAMSATWPPPRLVPPTVITVSERRNSRLTSL